MTHNPSTPTQTEDLFRDYEYACAIAAMVPTRKNLVRQGEARVAILAALSSAPVSGGGESTLLDDLAAAQGEIVRLKALGEEADRAAYDDGYSEGMNDAKSFGLDLWDHVRGWLSARDLYSEADFPEGMTAPEALDALCDHEREVEHAAARSAQARADRMEGLCGGWLRRSMRP